jgi:RNA polymerase sigma-70 factor (ECF subfamily)
MDMNEYVLEIVTLSRIAELRAEAAAWHRIKAATGPVKASRPLRATLGAALIRLGMRLRAGSVGDVVRSLPCHRRRQARLAAVAPVDADIELVEALRHDDPGAADRLIERYGDVVYRVALRIIGVREDAEEVTENVLLSVARDVDTFSGESSLATWIIRRAAEAAYQKLSARAREVRDIALEDVLPSLDADGEHFDLVTDWSKVVDEPSRQREIKNVVAEAIDTLPPDYRTALVLHDVEGLSDPDIAQTLGISPLAVKSRIHRSRLLVRMHLADYLHAA